MKYALLGNPVQKSISPIIMEHLCNYFNEEITTTIVEPSCTREFLEALPKFDAMNITFPFKESVSSLEIINCSSINFTNTLVRKNGILHGYNTDGIGFARSIASLRGKRILILGSGATAQASVRILRELKYDIVVLTRKEARSEVFKGIKVVTPYNWSSVNAEFDIAVNMTNAGLDNTELPFPEILYELDNVRYWIDINYQEDTPFLELARDKDKDNRDGLDMLKWQAGFAFDKFMGGKYKMFDIELALDELPRIH